MVAVTQSPLFSNDFPLDTGPLTNRFVHDEIANETIGAAAGATAASTNARIAAGTDRERGIRTIETVTNINRATTAADITALKGDVVRARPSLAFPRDLSGNGGAAFTRA